MIQSYSDNCDYLREKLGLVPTTDLYSMVQAVTEYIKANEDRKELVEITKTISKEKKRGRPRKKSSSN